MRKTVIIGTTLAGMMLLSGCSTSVESNKIPITKTAPIPSPTAEILASPISTATPTPQEVPTEVISATETVDAYAPELVAFVPNSVEQIGMSVEVRSPITDPEGYKEDMEKVLKVIHEQILADYSGEFLTGDSNIGMINPMDVVKFSFGVNLDPVASVYYDWKDSNGNSYKVPIFFFPAEDSEGKFVLSFSFSPTLKHINSRASADNPAVDWSLSEIIKKFPMQIVGNGSLETFYYFNEEGDEFLPTYFKAVDPGNTEGEGDLSKAYWDFISNGVFNRKCEMRPLMVKGGQG